MSSGFASFLRERAATAGDEAVELGAEGRTTEAPATLPGLPAPPAPAARGGFGAFLRERSAGGVPQATRGALLLADPAGADAFAKDRALARRAGLPAIAIEGPQRAEFERQDALRQNHDALRDAPATTRFLADPENARLAAGSVAELTFQERWWRSWKAAGEQDSRQRRVTQLQRRSWMLNDLSDSEEEELRLLKGVETPDFGIGAEPVPAWIQALREGPTAGRGFGAAFEQLFRAGRLAARAPIEGRASLGSTLEGATGAGVGAAGGAGLALLAGVPVAREVAIGAAIGGIATSGSSEGAAAFDAMRDRGVSESLARKVAIPVGLISGAVEVGALAAIPGVRQIARGKLLDAVSRPLLQRVLADIVAGGLSEGAEEAVQELTQAGGQWIADVHEGRDPTVTFEAEIDGQPVTLTGWDALLAKVSLAAEHGALAGIAFGGATGGVQVGASLVQRAAAVSRAQKRGEAMTKVAEALDASKIAERAPDVMEAQAEAAIAQHGAPETVYVPVARLQELFQSAATDALTEFDTAIPGLRERVGESLVTGADVALPSKQLATLLRTALGKELLTDLRFDPGEMTAREAEAAAPEIEREVRGMLDAQDQEEAGADAIGGYVRRLETALAESGAYDPVTASRMAQLEEANLRALGERAGLSPEEAVRELGQVKLEVEAPPRRRTLRELVLNETKPLALGEQPAGAPEPIPARIDRRRAAALLDEVRTGRKPEQEAMAHFPLLALLNRLGGVDPKSPVGGDLRSMGVTGRTVPGIFRKAGGRGALDDLVRSENPILATLPASPDTDYADHRAVLEAIREELAGRPVRTDEQTQAIVEAEIARESMAEEVDRLGLDLTRPDEELLQAIETEAIRQQAEPRESVPRETAPEGFELFQAGRESAAVKTPADIARSVLLSDPKRVSLLREALDLYALGKAAGDEYRDRYHEPVSKETGQRIFSELRPTEGEPWEIDLKESFLLEGLRGTVPEGGPKTVLAYRDGNLPESLRSRDYRDDVDLEGVSVLGLIEPGGASSQSDGTFAAFNRGRNRVVVAGWLSHKTGPDGEPLLLGAVEVPQAKLQALRPRRSERGFVSLFQGDARGSVSFDPELRDVTMRLAASRDLSTFLHEGGHLWLARLQKLATRAGATPEIAADWQRARAWLGAADGEALTTEQLEQWARGVEAYLREGKAPSLELRELFSRFLVWLTAIYRSASQLRVELNDDVRGVMDRLVATDAQMAELERSQEITPLAGDLLAELMSEPERARYEKVAAAARLKVREALTAAALAEVRAQQTESYAAAKVRLTKAVEAELQVRPDVTARHWLVTGEWLSTVPKPDDLAHGKLSREVLAGMYGEQVKNMPTGEHGWVALKGDDSAWHPDQVAELFGFDSGHDLVTKLRGLPARAKTLELEVKARLTAEFSDKGAAVAEGAASVLADIPEVAEMAMIEELAFARKIGGQKATPRQVLVQAARRIVAETQARELAPHKYRAAASRAAKTAAKALAAKDYQTAQQAKRQQALSLLLEHEARKAREEADSAGDYFRKVQEGATRKIIEKAGASYAGQIDALLGRFNLRNVSIRATRRRENLATWIAEHEAQGEVVPIPERIRNEAFKKNFRELTVGEIRALRESVQAIEHLARSKVEYVTAREKRLMEDVRGELIDGVEANVPKGLAPPGLPDYSDTKMAAARRGLSGIAASLQKIEFLVDWLDGGRPDGPWRRAVFTPIAAAEAMRNDLNVKYTKAIAELIAPLTRSGDYTTRLAVPELGANFTRSELLAIALNLGNESNLAKLLGGTGWIEGQVQAALEKRLSAADWKFVQGVWSLIDTLWPEIAAQERKLTGVVPERVEARELEVVTKDGERILLRGGYYPVVYDPERAHWAYARASRGVYAEVEDHFHRAITGHGHTHSRTEVTGPLLFDLAVIPRHLDQVIHDLTHRETLLRIDKLLDSNSVRDALKERIGPEYARLFLPWLQAIAKDRIAPPVGMQWWNKILRTVRVNSTIFTLGLRATTLAVQPLGHSNAVGILRTRLPNWQKHYVSGVRTYLSNPVAARDAAIEASGEMRHRSSTIDRDLRDAIRREFSATKLDRTLELAQQPGVMAMRLIGLVQFYSVDLPVWTAAYQGGQVEHGMSEAEAVEFADSAVRMSQSGGSVKDLAAVQRGDEFQRMWTTYFSYSSVVWNQFQDALRRVTSVKSAPDFLVSWVLYLAIPGMATMLMRDALTDDRDGEKKRLTDLEHILQALGVWDFAATIPGVRQVVAFGRYGTRPSTPFERAGGELTELGRDLAKKDVEMREILFDAARIASIATGLPTSWLLSEIEQELKERD